MVSPIPFKALYTKNRTFSSNFIISPVVTMSENLTTTSSASIQGHNQGRICTGKCLLILSSLPHISPFLYLLCSPLYHRYLLFLLSSRPLSTLLPSPSSLFHPFQHPGKKDMFSIIKSGKLDVSNIISIGFIFIKKPGFCLNPYLPNLHQDSASQEYIQLIFYLKAHKGLMQNHKHR